MSANQLIVLDLLLAIDPLQLEDEIHTMHDKGLIDRAFMQWLDDCIVGKTTFEIDAATLSAIRDEIKRLVWMAPEIPEDALRYYEMKIHDALGAKPVIQIPALVAELKGKNLLTMDFCNAFHRALDRGVDERRISQLQANCNWEILLDSVGPDMASKLKF